MLTMIDGAEYLIAKTDISGGGGDHIATDVLDDQCVDISSEKSNDG